MDSSNKLVLKNTLYLYSRQIFILIVNLYTYRLILQLLGVEDYGIYQVVGGIVALFTIINGALSSGSSRFITFALGKNNITELQDTFNASFRIHLLLAIIIFILLETIGLWYINTYLIVPEGRLNATNWIFQFSIISCMLTLTQVPYSALIIAHERMDIYAYTGIAEAIFKLILTGILFIIPNIDKLIIYGLLICIWSIILQGYYRFYCYKYYPESHLNRIRDKSLLKKILSFSFWDVIGCFTVQGNAQGVNILINAFFGVIYNASFGLANQVRNILTQFVNNFMTAVNPQLIKNYALHDYNKVKFLMFNSSKLGFLLFIAFAIPVFIEADCLLSFWLKEVPDKATLFLRLTLIVSMIRSFAAPVVTTIHASGNIKFLNIWSGGFSVIMTLPLTYFSYKLGYPIHYTYYITILVCLICNYIELIVLKKENNNFTIWEYTKNVYLPCCILVVPLVIPSILLTYIILPSIIRVIMISITHIILLIIFVFLFILTPSQRKEMILKLKVLKN